MRRKITIIAISCLLLLSGCSLISEVNSTVEYANDATEYIETVQKFSNQLPTLAKDAVRDEAGRESLESELMAMKEEIGKFNQIKPPTIAEDLHNQIMDSNKKFEEAIDLYLTDMENGIIRPLEETGILTTITDISTLLENIQQLVN
ncbi:DUF6376 family protein [Niallia oryzisoli]|uniref:DUF6376 family protein n=1 Tax=Niallia oryzisoli TaxID=1737571 RepID=A0ABZ2CMD9_9BACI